MKITSEWLIDNGFTFIPHAIMPSYFINISSSPLAFKVISLTIDFGNQYVYIREGNLNKPRQDDDVVAVFNSDYNGDLTIEFVEGLTNLLLFKNKKI